MSNAKLTDTEIKKALECCDGSFDKCGECPLDNVIQDKLRCWELEKSALDLINRQDQEIESLKAEVERLKKENKILSKNADTAFQDGLNEAQDLYADQIRQEIKAEAYKECIEKVKKKVFRADSHEDGFEHDAVDIDDLYDILNELVGDNNV